MPRLLAFFSRNSSSFFASSQWIQRVVTTRWVHCDDEKKLEEFRDKNAVNLGIDAAGELVYLAPSRVNLQLAQERWPDIQFDATREHAHVPTE